MNSKKQLRLDVLNWIICIIFALAMIFSFIDMIISDILIAVSLMISLFSLGLKEFWKMLKEFKNRENGKQIRNTKNVG